MSNYWANRIARSQDAISKKNIKQIENQLKKYYGSAMKRTIADFENVYNKVLAAQKDGKEITPAWLYQLDSYWKMQGQLKQELQKLGDKQISILSDIFETNFFEVYYSIAIPSQKAFSTISIDAARQMINQIWVADGKSFSQRIWGNTEKLVETLNEELVHCVVTGKKSSDLKQLLQERFNVSYNNADMIARTEIAHIQTQAAQQRYKDYGIKQVEVSVAEDERTCPICAKHEGEKYYINDKMPVPFHPRCRCAIIPVIDNNELEEDIMEDKKLSEEEIQKHNEQVAKEYRKHIDNLKNNGMTKENLEIVMQSWARGEKVDKSQLILYKRKCAYCGGYLDSIYQRGKVYHDECLQELIYDDLQEIVKCIDCGENFIRYKKYKNQVRCPECQAKYRRKYKAEKEKERRKKKKEQINT